MVREEKGRSQNELAKHSGVSHPAINRAEFGAKLTEKKGLKLAAALEIRFDRLMRGEENKKNWLADQKVIDLQWKQEDVGREIWDRMDGEDQT